MINIEKYIGDIAEVIDVNVFKRGACWVCPAYEQEGKRCPGACRKIDCEDAFIDWAQAKATGDDE